MRAISSAGGLSTQRCRTITVGRSMSALSLKRRGGDFGNGVQSLKVVLASAAPVTRPEEGGISGEARASVSWENCTSSLGRGLRVDLAGDAERSRRLDDLG